jgi:hypothetical protein
MYGERALKYIQVFKVTLIILPKIENNNMVNA